MRIYKNYYSGFCLNNEEDLFKEYIEKNDFTISGFSYGAIKAFESAFLSSQRIDKLQLFSPAFFQFNDEKFKRMQLMFFKKDASSYCDEFLKNVSYPLGIDCSSYFKEGTYEELEELLYYEWCEEKLQKLVNKGTKIEVFLGEKDKIIDSLKVKEFFVNYATVYYIKNKGHLL